MKGLRIKLSPFTPDISGACAVLYELGGIIVISDAGGCTGNVCGFDEPRWFTKRSAIFSAGLRDIDAILGRDDRFIDKIGDAARHIEANFAAVVGTPVPAVIATDYRAVRRLTEKKTGLPVVTIETNGTALYDEGAAKAYAALFETFADESGEEPAGFTGVLGAAPLDLPALDSVEQLREALSMEEEAAAFKNGRVPDVIFYGEENSLPAIKTARFAQRNVVLSPGGLRAARLLKERFGVPYEIRYPLPRFDAAKFAAAHPGKRLLIVHQQIMADAMRRALEAHGGYDEIAVGTWFMADGELARPCDASFLEENDMNELAAARGFDVIIGDPVFERTLTGWRGDYVPLPHFAVSGRQHAPLSDADFWEALS